MPWLTLFTLRVSQAACLPARLHYSVFCSAFVSVVISHLSVLAVGGNLERGGINTARRVESMDTEDKQTSQSKPHIVSYLVILELIYSLFSFGSHIY